MGVLGDGFYVYFIRSVRIRFLHNTFCRYGMGRVCHHRAQKEAGAGSIAATAYLWLPFSYSASLAYTRYESGDFLDYIMNAYRLGQNYGYGTGALGAALAYPLLRLVSLRVHTLFSVTAAFCCLLVLTNLSIAKVGEQVGAVAKNTAEQIGKQHREHKELKKPGRSRPPSAAAVICIPRSFPTQRQAQTRRRCRWFRLRRSANRTAQAWNPPGYSSLTGGENLRACAARGGYTEGLCAGRAAEAQEAGPAAQEEPVPEQKIVFAAAEKQSPPARTA
jgi:hypothetical protein